MMKSGRGRPRKDYSFVPVEQRTGPQELDLDYDSGTELEVTTNDALIHGTVKSNPQHCKDRQAITLFGNTVINLQSLHKSVEEKPWTLYRQEIRAIKVVKKPRSMEAANSDTFVLISNEKDLKGFYSKHLTEGVKKVAMEFHGKDVGQNGHTNWISMYLSGTVFCFDVKKLAKPKRLHFWDDMKNQILENNLITKIVFNCRPIHNYLEHLQRKMKVKMKNVIDLQVYDAYVRHFQGSHSEINLLSLTQLLEMYLKGDVLRDDMKFLETQLQVEKFEDGFCQKSLSSTYRRISIVSVKYLDNIYEELKELIYSPLQYAMDTFVSVGFEAETRVLKDVEKKPWLTTNTFNEFVSTFHRFPSKDKAEEYKELYNQFRKNANFPQVYGNKTSSEYDTILKEEALQLAAGDPHEIYW